MNDQMAKMKVLQQIIDLFSDQQLSGLKKKGEQPDMMAVSVKADGDGKSDPLAALAGDDAKKSDDDGDESPDMLQKLAEMYGNSDDKKDDDKAC